MPTLTTATAIPPSRTSGRASAQVWGLRKVLASSSSSRISTSTTIATDARTLPAISGAAWWLMDLTSGARGLTAGLATPESAGESPWNSPTVGAPLSVELMMIELSR